MQVTTKAIVLSALKYGDTSLIVRAYTLSDGLKSYLLKGILTAKRGKLKTAYFQPLSQLELVAKHKNKGSLERILEAKPLYPYSSLHIDFSKNAVVLFLAEILQNSIREEECNSALFNYLQAALQWLDNCEKAANFHIYFMLGLSKYLGFYPDLTQMHLPIFDLQEGRFVSDASLNPLLQGKSLEIFKQFLGINFDAMQGIPLSSKERKELLNTLVLYYQQHLQGFRKPKSLEVLNQVFA